MSPSDSPRLIAGPRRSARFGIASQIGAAAVIFMVGCDDFQMAGGDDSQYGSDGPHSGWFASWAGDVDGDGSQDILISTTCEPVGGRRYGCARVYSTKKRDFIWSRVNSEGVHPSFWMPHPVGDVNGDGRDDICSATWPELRVFDVVDDRTLLDLRPDLSNCLVSLGDVDGDGGEDLLIGGYPREKGTSKFASLVSGKSGQILWSVEGHESPSTHRPFAWKGCRVGDVNGDGVADCAIDTESNRLRVLSGRDGALLRELDVPMDWMWEAFTGVPDLDNDGACDLFVRGTSGTPLHVVSGATGRRLFSMYAPCDLIGVLSTAGDYDRDGICDLLACGWVYSGRDGHRLATIDDESSGDGFRDLDGDGREELLIARNLWGTEAEQAGVDVWRQGRVEVLSGIDHSVLFTVDRDDLPARTR